MNAERGRTWMTLGAIAFGLTVATGCAGARSGVVANDAEYPVSLSRGVRDASGVLVTRDRVQRVGRFEDKATSWGMLYSFVPLSKKKDISQAVNQQVAKLGGDAIVNLRVATAHCASDFFFLLTMIPFWPGCSSMKIEGDIIKVAPAAPKPAPAEDGNPPVTIASKSEVRL